MSKPADKGQFTTKVSEDLINEALSAVKKHRDEASGEAGQPIAEEPDIPTTQVSVDASTGFEESSTAQHTFADELANLRAEVDLAQARSREMMEKLKAEHESHLRAVADLENVRKRTAKEKEDFQKYASEKLLRDLLPVLDNFDRALEHARTSTDFDSLKTGVTMTRKLFEDTLAKHGVKTFVAVGKVFDPNVHEAMSAQESTDVPHNHVVSEVVRGFTLNDRLIRPALVVVAKAPEGKSADGSSTPPSSNP